MFNEFDFDKLDENETSPYFSKQASEGSLFYHALESNTFLI